MEDTVRFVLDGDIIEINDVDPTRTVLQYLREDLGRTGTKEGCAEGDCGACTVVLAELTHDGDTVKLKAINSCIQFLPTLHGKELITVESLRPAGSELHPVQQAMVDCHGSQCGFCTPGFVMSLFAVYEQQDRPGRVAIDDALAGNLCRCTGYRPIIAAARQMYELPKPKRGFVHVEQLQTVRSATALQLQQGERRFCAPVTTDELAQLLADYPDATLLAGGTDVGLWVTKQHRLLETVIYTGRVAALQQIVETDSHLEIGAAVTLTDAMEALQPYFPALEELWRRFASPPIRNAGTLGGNVANGSPIGDSMAALMAAGSTLVLRSVLGERETTLEDFYIDYQVQDLRSGEFLEKIRIPKPAAADVLRCYKLSKRFDQDISAVCAAFRLRLTDGKVDEFAMACGGLAAVIKRAAHCEQALQGAVWDEAAIAAAAAALTEDFAPISDMRASAAYRLRATQNLLRRFFAETTSDDFKTVYDYGR